jgi:hypothetical protein
LFPNPSIYSGRKLKKVMICNSFLDTYFLLNYYSLRKYHIREADNEKDEAIPKLPPKIFNMMSWDPTPDVRKLVPDPSKPGTLTLQGEGPNRLIVPQKIAGSPDRPSTAFLLGDGWDYDSNKDHNAGFSVRSVAAIRVEPLPTGTTDFAWTDGGWNLVDKARVVIYGAIDPCTYPLLGSIEDRNGKPIGDVKISFGLVSLGQVGETKTDKHGKFRMELPVGEYVVIPTKDGDTFDRESISIQLSERGYSMEFTASPAP